MDRNNKFLRISFIGILIMITMSCFSNNEEEYIMDLPDYNPTLDEAIGRYYYIPSERDFEYFDLKKGDTLFLEIKKDSTYLFTKFYYGRENNNTFYNKSRLKSDLKGKLTIKDNFIELLPNLDVKNATMFFLGFKMSKKNDLYYYYAINSPTEYSYFEYYLVYKKINP